MVLTLLLLLLSQLVPLEVRVVAQIPSAATTFSLCTPAPPGTVLCVLWSSPRSRVVHYNEPPPSPGVATVNHCCPERDRNRDRRLRRFKASSIPTWRRRVILRLGRGELPIQWVPLFIPLPLVTTDAHH